MKAVYLSMILLLASPAFADETRVQIAPELTVQTAPKYLGVLGVRVNSFNNQILEIFPGSSLLEHGLKVGDYILEVEGREVHGEAFQNASIGQPGTSVRLTVKVMRRYGFPKIVDMDVERRDIRQFKPRDPVTYSQFTPYGVRK